MSSKKQKGISQAPLHFMLLAPVVLVLIYSYVPMAGIVIAFQKFIPAKGLFGDQKWVGFDNFTYMLELPDTLKILRNTVSIASMKIVGGLIVPITVALMLNEIRSTRFKRISQTLIYLPHFFSWVILAGVFVNLLSLEYGIVNQVIQLFGMKPIYFLGDRRWFPFTMVILDVWKGFGFSTIVYLAALTSIDPELYDAASIDGAGKLNQAWHITLPGMRPIIVLLATLSLGSVLNAGFNQIFNFYNPQVYETGDIIDTFVYRIGLLKAQYGLATAVGLFKSVVSCTLISVSYFLAYRYTGYRIF